MTQINSNENKMQVNENKMQSDPYVKQSKDLTIDPATGLPIDPATGLPIDPATGLPITLDSIESMSEAEALSLLTSMFDLLDFKDSALIANNPQIPAPFLTRIGILREAIAKGQIKQVIDTDASTKNIKGNEVLQTTVTTTEISRTQTVTVNDQQLTGSSDDVKPNRWFQYPNAIGAMMIVSLAIAKSMAAAKVDEGKMKQNLNMKIYQLGMDAAQDAQDLRNLQAQQETLKAMQSFVSAGLAVYQMFSIVQQRGKDKGEAEENSGLKDQEKVIADLNNKLTQNTTPAGTEDPNATPMLTKEDVKIKEQLKVEETKLATIKQNVEQKMFEISRRSTAMNEAKFRAINSFTEGVFTLMGTVITKEQGVVEKDKQELETLQQLWSKLYDALKQDVDDANQLLEKSLNLAQTMSGTSAMLSTKG